MYLVTTIPGFEDVCSHDIESKTRARPQQLNAQGRLLVPGSTSPEKLMKLRTVKECYRIKKDTQYESLEQLQHYLQRAYRKKQVWVLLKDAPRRGIDYERWRRELGQKLSLDSQTPDVIVRIDIIRDRLIHSERIGENHIEDYRAHAMPFSLQPRLAHCMVRLIRPSKHETILDPFCGGGSIPIEAALSFGPRISIVGKDINSQHIRMAEKNAKKARVRQHIRLGTQDARESVEETDYIITELPYQLDKKNLSSLYKGFLGHAKKGLKKEALVIVDDAALFTQTAKRLGLRIMETRKLIKGGYHPRLIRLKNQ